MADVRCPMCGKSNPADQEICQFCQARIKPLHVSSQEQEGQESALPDWLSSLRQDEEPSQPAPPSPDSSADWLSGLRDQSDEQIGQEESDWETRAFDESLAAGDFSSRLDGFPAPEKSLPGESQARSAGKRPEEVEEEPDWWRKLGADQSAGIDYHPADMPDWPSDFQKDVPEIEPEPSPEGLPQEIGAQPVQKEEVPEWLDRMQPQEPQPEPVQPIEEVGSELPDWLSASRPETPVLPSEPEAIESAPGLEQPIQAAGEELPGWLSGPPSEIPALSSEPEALEPVPDLEQPVQEAGEKLPDWLTAMQAEALEISPEVEATESAPDLELPIQDAGEQLPDWLAEMKPEGADWPPGQVQQGPAPEQVEPATKPEAGLPEWLAGGQANFPDWVSDEEAGVLPPATPSENLPEWMVEAGIPLAPDTEPMGMPDWAVFSEAAKTPAEETLQSQVSGQEPPTAEEEALEIDQLALGGEEFAFETGESPEEDLSWLDELESAFPEIAETPVSGAVIDELAKPGLEPVSGEALPDWLITAPEEVEGPAAVELAGEVGQGDAGQTDLSPADLPSWLEAMRPVAAVGAGLAVAEGVTAGNVEGAGPLAGLRGVLPAEPDIYQISKPPAYTSKIEVTDVHQTHADLWSDLVRSEVEAEPLPARPVITPQHLLRLGIAVVLILAVVFPILAGFPVMELPGFTPEVYATSQLIASLPGGAPVLLAVDYQPGLSGEMDATAAAVVDNLMLQGAHLTLVSTIPTGPLQAERLLSQVNRTGGHQYAPNSQYINLGFIPGGPTGLQSFALAPQETLPVDTYGNSAWEIPPLQSITSLSNFAMLIVLTENPDTARAWIEQVQPAMGVSPMVMVLSAQAEPLVRPYYEAQSPQVQGLVVGLASGAAYEALLGRQGPAAAYWDSFSVGMLVALILILAGGAISFLTTRLAQKKNIVEGKTKA